MGDAVEAVDDLGVHLDEFVALADQAAEVADMGGGTQTSGTRLAARRRARMRASLASVLMRAWAIWATRMGLATLTWATRGASRSTTCQALVVASRTTWSVGRRCCEAQ